MAGVKNINVVSGTGNPVQMQDLQNLWSVINTLCTAKSNSITVLAGMKTKTVGSETVFEAGIIFYNGQAYYLADGAAKPGQYLYVASQPSDQRIYEDGVTRYMYTDYLVNVSSSATATGIGTLIGQATLANVAMWQTPYIAPGSITTAMLQDNAVTTPKIALGAVTNKQLALQTIQNNNIEDQMIIGYEKIMDGTVTEQTIGGNSVGTSQLKNKSVTTEKIADGAITNDQIARATIDGVKLVPKTISDSNIADEGVVTENIADGAITTEKIFPGAVGTRALDAGAVGSNNIADGAVIVTKLGNNSVTAPKIGDGAVNMAKIGSGTPLRPYVTTYTPPFSNSIPIGSGTFSIIKGVNGTSFSAIIALPFKSKIDLNSILVAEILVRSTPAILSFTYNEVVINELSISANTAGAHVKCYFIDDSWIFSANSLLSTDAG